MAGNPNNPFEKLVGTQEYGWYEIDGIRAVAAPYEILDPAIYAVHVEAVQTSAPARSQPWVMESPTKMMSGSFWRILALISSWRSMFLPVRGTGVVAS